MECPCPLLLFIQGEHEKLALEGNNRNVPSTLEND